jgi:hypothetical protein
VSSLVVRDLRSGRERVWSNASEGGISALSWARDGRRLAFQTVACCDRATRLHVLDATAAPGDVKDVPPARVPAAAGDTLFHDPTFAGGELLMLADYFGDAMPVSTGYAVVTSAGKVVLVLQDEGLSLDADASGQHLLVSLYGVERPGNLLRYTRGDRDPFVLGRGIVQARW